MHDTTARLRARCAVRAAALLVPGAATAAEAAPTISYGPWLFATVAFVVVTALSFLAGLWRAGSGQRSCAPDPGSSAR